MTDKVQKIREEVVRMHNLLPVMDGDNISVNYADRICTTLEMYIDSLQEEPVSEELEEELSKLLKECEVDAEYVHQDFLHIVACHFANWQKDKDFQYVKKECERTGGCCDNDIAIEAAKRHPYYYASEMEAYANIGFKEGAMWQKQQDQETIELAEDHAMLAGMEKMKEEMMKDTVETEVWDEKPPHITYFPKNLKGGDKIKLIIIKEE